MPKFLSQGTSSTNWKPGVAFNCWMLWKIKKTLTPMPSSKEAKKRLIQRENFSGAPMMRRAAMMGTTMKQLSGGKRLAPWAGLWKKTKEAAKGTRIVANRDSILIFSSYEG